MITLLDLLAMEHLPADTLTTLSSFLTSRDAFRLSHTSSWWLRYVGDGSFWQRRLRFKKSWAKRFMATASLLFQGRHTANNLQADSFAFLTNMKDDASRFHLSSLSTESFSFDVWFSLLPATAERCFGGVLYGMQSAERASRPWPHYHQPIVVVNPSGDLHCSVLDAKPVVATALQPKRWYHQRCANFHCNKNIAKIVHHNDNFKIAINVIIELVVCSDCVASSRTALVRSTARTSAVRLTA